MEFFDAVYQRRAIKHFDPEHRLTDEEIDKLMQAAIQSPTSFNIQHWRFVLVTDPELRRQIRAAGNDQPGVVDQDVQPIFFLHNIVHELIDTLAIAHVAGPHNRLSTRLLDLTSRFL